jgi:DNA uptake protein ComE-like DNA-binding protein
MMMHRVASGFFGMLALALALLAVQASPARAQAAKGLIDPNTAAEGELQSLPAMTPAIVKGMIERRPFKSVVELNKFLIDQKVTPEQAREFYRKAFVPINLNTGTREEFLLIPGVGSRMSGEFMEYRPWKTWTQFDKEIGKYVGQAETERFKQYVFIPPN